MARASWREVFSTAQRRASQLRSANRQREQFLWDRRAPLWGWRVDCYLGGIQGAKDEYRGPGSYTDVYGEKFLVLASDGTLYEYVHVVTDESGNKTEQRNAYKVEHSFRIRIFGKDVGDTTNRILDGLNKLGGR